MNIFDRIAESVRMVDARAAAQESVKGRDRPAYEALHLETTTSLRPKGYAEVMAAERVVKAGWRLAQAHRAEAGLFAMGDANPLMKAVLRQSGIEIDPLALAYSGQADEINKAARYVAAAEKSHQQALTAFYRLQAARGVGPLAKGRRQ